MLLSDALYYDKTGLLKQVYLHFAFWLAPRTSSANREVGGSSLTVSTDDPLG